MFGLGIVNSFGLGSTSNDDSSESMLLRLMQAAASTEKNNNDDDKKTIVHWNHVLQYMKDHCDILQQQEDDDDLRHSVLPYPSPFHAHYGANGSLQQEYMHHRVSIWSCALSNAPIAIVSALCHVIPSHLWQDPQLFPKRRLPLHMLCRYPPRKQQQPQKDTNNNRQQRKKKHDTTTTTTTSEELCELLMAYHPMAVWMRDDTGYTPLHYACCYHASLRTIRFVQILISRPCSQEQLQKFIQNTNMDDKDDYEKILQMIKPTKKKRQAKQHSSKDDTNDRHSSYYHYSAAMIPHRIHRQLPLTMAAMHGMTYEPIHVLYQAYPDAKHAIDQHGRTALHCYLFQEEATGLPPSPQNLVQKKGNNDFFMSNRTITERKMDEKIIELLCSSRVARTVDHYGMSPLHIVAQSLAYQYCCCSDSMTNASNMDQNTEETKVATMAWWPSLDIVQRVLDCHVQQLILPDHQGRTPLMVLFDTAYQILSQQQPPSSSSQVFDPPLELITLLLYHPDHQQHQQRSQNHHRGKKGSTTDVSGRRGVDPGYEVASMEDMHGRLPIHAALLCECSTDLIRILLQAHPTAVYHADHQERVPLHYATRMTRILPNDVAKKNNNTLLATIQLLLSSSSSSTAATEGSGDSTSPPSAEATIDGRLALKLEDSNGYFPIHYACQNRNMTVEILECMIQAYPKVATLTTPDGDLPLHCLLLPMHSKEYNNKEADSETNDGNHDDPRPDVDFMEAAVDFQQSTSSSNKKRNNNLSTKIQNRILDLRPKIQCLLRPLLSSSVGGEKWMKMADSKLGMLPLHIVVLFDAGDYETILRILELYPKAATTLTKNLSIVLKNDEKIKPEHNQTNYSLSPLDLHDICKNRDEKLSNQKYDEVKLEDWHHKRELLFSFGPTLESHRHRNDLLGRCVRIVVNEILQSDDKQGTFHYRAMVNAATNADGSDLEVTRAVSDLAIAAINRSKIGERRRRKRMISNQLAPNKSRFHPTKNTATPAVPKSGKDLMQPPTSKQQKQPSLVNTYLSRLADWQDQPLKASSSIYDEDDTHLHYDVREIEPGASNAEDDSDAVEVLSGSDEESYYSDRSAEDFYSGPDGQTDERIQGMTSHQHGNYGNRLGTTYEEELADSDENRDCGNGSQVSTCHNSVNSLPETRKGQSFDDELSNISVTSVFERAKQRASNEEKKDDRFASKLPPTVPDQDDNKKRHSSTFIKSTPIQSYKKPPYMSEVGMRLWTFFVLYCDFTNPSDTYVKNLQEIVEQISFQALTELVAYPVPSYSQNYIGKVENLEGVCFRDVASPKCRELIHKTCYFVGRYEFRATASGGVLYQSSNNEYIVVEADEWIFTTEETTGAKSPGISEENIWTTGEIPAEIGVTFRTQKRPVWIKFTRDAMAYNSEINIRRHLGISVDEDDRPADRSIAQGVMPLLRHYSAIGTTRKIDEIYRLDIHDKRFNSFVVFCCSSHQRKILLKDFPFALVFPASPFGTLYDYSFRFGMVCSAEAKTVISQIASALEDLHVRGVCHQNICLRSFALKVDNEKTSKERRWVIWDLSRATQIGDVPSYLGAISAEGIAQFATETLPPEMFVSLSSQGLKRYLRYWKKCSSQFNNTFDKRLIDPIVDVRTGDTFVVKCHSLAARSGTEAELPYELIVADQSTDIWALGALIFYFFSGQSLFHCEARSGRLADYGSICNWDPTSMIYESVSDPLVQHLLLKLLSNRETRRNLNISDILSHPLFTDEKEFSKKAKKIVFHQRNESAAHKRALDQQLHETTVKVWLAEKSVSVQLWDFDLLEKFHTSPSEIVKMMMPRKSEFFIPCSFVLLPFDFKRTNCDARSTMVEKIGEMFLHLGRSLS